MGQVVNKFKKDDQGKKQVPTEPKGLADMLNKAYDDTKFKEGMSFEDFYHEVYLIIEKLNLEAGAMQFKLPNKDKLQKVFKESGTGEKLDKERFKKIMGELIKFDDFSFGSGALDAVMYLFGIPIIAVLAKRTIPATRPISDDVVIPVATAGTVFVLTKTHKL